MGRASCPVKKHLHGLRAVTGITTLPNELLQDETNIVRCLMDRIDTLGMKKLYGTRRCNQRPIGLGGPTIGNEHHDYLLFLVVDCKIIIYFLQIPILFCNFAPIYDKNMKIKLFTIWLLLCMAMPAMAVLKEKDLANTLSILREELTNYRIELERQTGFMKDQQDAMASNMYTIINQCSQNSLMLYSQKSGYIFDLTYACHEATQMYHEFRKSVIPFENYLNQSTTEIARFDSLVNVLSTMNNRTLTERAAIDRNVCLTLSVNILRTLKSSNDQLNQYIRYYHSTERQLRSLNDYAQKRYVDIQESIFSNGGENFFQILANLKSNVSETSVTLTEKYKPQSRNRSQWDSRLMFGLLAIILFGSLISVAINLVLLRFALTRLLRDKRWANFASRLLHIDDVNRIREVFMSKRTCIIMSTTVVTFAIVLAIIRMTADQNFIIMACDLLVEYAWLLGVILISLLIRLSKTEIKSGFRIYAPLMMIDFIIISFRIILIPNILTNLILPPILLTCSIWQWNTIKRQRKHVPKSDVTYTYLSFAVFIASLCCSWTGYTLLSVELLIWWIMQLTCILTITCFSGLLRAYASRNQLDKKPITKTCGYRFVYHVLLPIAAVASVMFSVYWAADIFNLSDTTLRIYGSTFIDSPNFRISIFAIFLVTVLYIIFNYINKTAKAFLKLHFERNDRSTAASKNVMAKNVVQVLVWGIWLILALSIFHVNNTWLVVVSGGLSTGIGFAMKDIIENIYYGISLMMGRIKVGDLIECDGIRGKVSSISYTSTLMDTIDGSVIAFQNSQLFTKNYKNLTRNHGYELASIPIGVAYGSNANEVKQVITEAVNMLTCRDPKKEVKVVFTGFGDNSIDFKIIVWVPVLTGLYAKGEVMEAVYNALNAHNIEIPFPQRDIHIIQETSKDDTAGTK